MPCHLYNWTKLQPKPPPAAETLTANGGAAVIFTKCQLSLKNAFLTFNWWLVTDWGGKQGWDLQRTATQPRDKSVIKTWWTQQQSHFASWNLFSTRFNYRRTCNKYVQKAVVSSVNNQICPSEPNITNSCFPSTFFYINFLHYRDKEVNQSPQFQLPPPTPQLLKITLDPTQTLFLTKQVSGDFFYFWMILLWQQLQTSSLVAASQTWTQVSCWIAEACPQGPLNTVPSRDVHKRSFINSRRQATNHFNNYFILKKGVHILWRKF